MSVPLVRTLVLYLAVICAVRLMGKRQLGEMDPAELVVTILVSDLAAVPMLHELTHLPVIVDPSHATGINRLVSPMALAAAACGADGLIIEVHNDPIHALCDGAQSLRPEQFDALAKKLLKLHAAVKELEA